MAMIICPECGQPVSDKAETCPHCGVKIAGNPDVKHNDTEGDGGEATAAPVCATTATASCSPQSSKNADAPVCATTASCSPQSNKKVWIVAGIVAAVVCVAGLLFFFHATGEQEETAYRTAMQSTERLILETYLDKYADAPAEHRDSVQAKLTLLVQVEGEWHDACVSGTKQALEAFLKAHPDTPLRAEAEHRIDSIDWAVACHDGTPDAYAAYAKAHPEGEHADDAALKASATAEATITAEERSLVAATFRQFFKSICAKDAEGLKATATPVLTTCLGRSDVPSDELAEFMNKLYRGGVEKMTWRVPEVYDIAKMTGDDGAPAYNVVFTAVQRCHYDDGSDDQSKYNIQATLNVEGHISALTVNKAVE